MTFQITALDRARFQPLFAMTDAELRDRMAVRLTADKKPGFPCRVSLADAEIGDELILVNYEHQDTASPYRSSHAVFVRTGVEQAHPEVDEVPELLLSRVLSVRAFSATGMIVSADLLEGRELATAIDRQLGNPVACYLHVHYAKFGCYAARADRA